MADPVLLGRLVEDAPVGIWCGWAHNGSLIFANRAFREIMGLEARNDVGVGEFSRPYGIHNRHGELYPEDQLPFTRALRAGTTVVVDDIVIHRTDGEKVHVRAVARPVYEGKAASHVIVAFFDITREVLAEQAREVVEQRGREMQALAERYSLAEQGDRYAVFEWKPVRRKLYLSPELSKLLAVESSVIIENPTHMVHTADLPRLVEAVEAHYAGGAPVDVECRLVTRHGLRWFNLRAHAEWNDRGEPVRLAGSIRDIDAEKRMEEMRGRFIEHAIAAEDAQRRRITRELHDETGQSLTSLLVGLRNLEQKLEDPQLRYDVNKLRELTARTLEEVGRLARGLHPSALDDLGFAAAVEKHVEDFSQRHQIEVGLHLEGVDKAHRLPPPVETALYRIVQEALTNTLRHAAATTASIVVQRIPHGVRAIIEDDGRGMSREQTESLQGGGLGLHGIRERVALFGGELTIESSPDRGTSLYVHIPLSRDD